MQPYGLKPGGVVFGRDFFFYSCATFVPNIVIYISHAIALNWSFLLIFLVESRHNNERDLFLQWLFFSFL